MRRAEIFMFVLGVGVVCANVGVALEPKGIVYEAEAISSPADAWVLNESSEDRWRLWTDEPDIERKRSGKAVLASPNVAADRERPEDGAPPLHSVVTDLEPGVYHVYVSNPGGRPLAYSLDGGTWVRHAGSEWSAGAQDIADGRFEFWVDDRYAYPAGNPGPGYYDYVRFVRVPDAARNVERDACWAGLDAWLAKDGRGFSVQAASIEDRVGFEDEGQHLKGEKPGDRFTYVFDRDGTFYMAVVMNDDEDGTEELTASLSGKEIGVIVGDGLGRALFRFKEPLRVKAGDALTFTCGTFVGYYRVEQLVFASEAVMPPPPAFKDVEYWSPTAGAVDVCWTTTSVVATGRFEYGTAGFDTVAGPDEYAGRNHRVQLRGLDPTATYKARIVTEYHGTPIVSELLHFKPTPPTPPPTQEQIIPLEVAEPTGQPRVKWPATIGVPFAKGTLACTEDLRLFDAAGAPVTLQAECACRWPDGSVKWATLSFLADTNAGDEAAVYELRAQPVWPGLPPLNPPVLRVDETDDAWRVRTDALAFDVAKAAPDLFDHVGFDRNGDGVIGEDECIGPRAEGAGLSLDTAEGDILTCGPLEGSLDVETNGPVRAVLRWSGPLANADGPSDWFYVMHVTLWKGQPTMGIDVAVGNGATSPAYRAVRTIVARVPLNGDGPVQGSFDGAPLEAVPDAEGLWLLQDHDSRFKARTAAGLVGGERTGGLAVAADSRTRVAVAMPDFWQTYPKGYAVTPDGLEVRILPALAPDTYDGPEDAPWFYRLCAWFKDGQYLFRAGQLTRAGFVVHFDTPEADADFPAYAAWCGEPLLPQAAPEYLCSTLASVRPIFPRAPGLWDAYEALFDRSFEASLQDRDTCRTYGWMHYGDWYGERYCNYGNSEYDMGWALALQWMRTGDRRLFERGLDMARHSSSVDVLHGAAFDDNRGLVWEHCFNHVGTALTLEELRLPPEDETARKYLEQFGGMITGAMDPQGHVFQQGHWLYACLTGDSWFHDVAERIAVNQSRKLTPAFNFSIERSGGWPIINAANAYAFSGNPYHLNAARLMVERCLERQDPETGGWLHTPPVGETDGQPVLGGKAFAVGILSEGLLYYLAVEPEDRPDVRHMLVRGADWLMNEAWNPGKGFRYITNAPNYKEDGRRGITCQLNADIIGFAYEETGDAKYIEFWKDMMAGAFEGTHGMGKSFTQATRQTIFGLTRVMQWGIVDTPAAP
ncbi:MAG TPA: hypothetical protein PLO37_19955 [Candidatus Hydrogenedentes bacterium]|nr:hypothetical protein [Candidatus Hydrogenedentota bacterium]HPG69130.1 hypothetical protein [Candidatus Hydrogenedentota bacterium]